METIYKSSAEFTTFYMIEDYQPVPDVIWLNEDGDTIYYQNLMDHTAVPYQYKCEINDFSEETGIEIVIDNRYNTFNVNQSLNKYVCYLHNDQPDSIIILAQKFFGDECEDHVVHLVKASHDIQTLYKMRNYIPPSNDYRLLSLSACHIYNCDPEIRKVSGDSDISVVFSTDNGGTETVVLPKCFLNILGSEFITGQLQSNPREVNLSFTPGTYQNYQQAVQRVLDYVLRGAALSNIGYLCQLFDAIGSVYVPQIVRDNLNLDKLMYV